MPLQQGQRIGPYEVVAWIGAGGMGVVWRARDTRLERDVALKTLPPGFASKPDRVARLTREARLLASLSHPHVAAVHGLEESDGEQVVVMELVEGPTLAARMRRGRLPQDEALAIARQIAEALEAAHDRGIVHRDLKPANVAFSKEGGVKVLDFGLATALSPESGDAREAQADATTRSATAAGGVVGTARYMSPEQAQGKPVDRGSDVWALGVVLFEMLAGERLFAGESPAEARASVPGQEVDLAGLPADVPAPVRRLLGRCLVRDPRDRLRDVREARIALERASLEGERAAGPSPAPSRGLSRRAVFGLSAVLAVAAGTIGVATALAPRLPARGTAPSARFELEMPPDLHLPTTDHAFDLSPDGRTLVLSLYEQRQPIPIAARSYRLFVRSLDGWETTPLAGGEGGRNPVFSPDGRRIAFIARTEEGSFLKTVPASGGSATTLCECACVPPFGLSWAGNEWLLFAAMQGPLRRVPATGGTPEAVTRLDASQGELSHRMPHVLPDGKTVLFTSLRNLSAGPRWQKARIYAQRLGSETRSVLVEDGSDGRFMPPGFLVFAREGSLFVARLAPSGLTLASDPVRLLESVRHAVLGPGEVRDTGAAQYAVARDGRLAYVRGSVDHESRRVLLRVDASGRETATDLPAQSYRSINLSPDGKELLVTHNYPNRQVKVVDLARGVSRSVTTAGSHSHAIWGPGAGEITFDSDHEGARRIYVRRLEAPAGEAETLWKGAEDLIALGNWTPDGKRLCFEVATPAGGTDILEVSRGGEVRPLVATPQDEGWPEISPDGRWLAYAVASEAGRFEVFVRPLASPGVPVQASVDGGKEPLWARDGRTLFYKSARPDGNVAILRVPVSVRNGHLELGRAGKLFEGEYGYTYRGGRNYDVSMDGWFTLDKPDPAEPPKERGEAWYPTRVRIDLGGFPALLKGLERPE